LDVAVCPWQRDHACPEADSEDLTTPAGHCAGRITRSAGLVVTPAPSDTITPFTISWKRRKQKRIFDRILGYVVFYNSLQWIAACRPKNAAVFNELTSKRHFLFVKSDDMRTAQAGKRNWPQVTGSVTITTCDLINLKCSLLRAV